MYAFLQHRVKTLEFTCDVVVTVTARDGILFFRFIIVEEMSLPLFVFSDENSAGI